MPLQEIANNFKSILSRYTVVGGNIETNGIGRAMYDALRPNFRKIKGFTTTQDSKTEMVRRLIADIESMNIELPTVDLCPALHKELGTYTYKMSNNGKLTFGHMAGAKDDHVDSLLLANISRNQFVNRGRIRVKNISRIQPSFGSTQ